MGNAPKRPLRRETAPMTMPSPVVVWLRNDLRIADNPALTAACAHGPVIVLYVLDEDSNIRPLGAASRWWLDKSLRALASELEACGSALTLRRGVAAQVVREVVIETGASGVYWNKCYDRTCMRRDEALQDSLATCGVECRAFNAGLINEPCDVMTLTGNAYRVFTPYWRAARQRADATPPGPRPARLTAPQKTIDSDRLDSWRLHPSAPDWSMGFSDWKPGESGALARLSAFLDGPANHYSAGRDFPAQNGVSRLSPHLHFGEIGPRQVWAAVQDRAAAGGLSSGQAEGYLRQLGWRDFNHHLLFHFPAIEHANFNGRFDNFAWRDDPDGLEAWKRGLTGYPIVDAGMRQLWSTGWMHNRVRMIAASFLVKDLLIDWRVGEAWFWNTLVDADLANNVGNWQWVAGSGADAAPYYRVFNPTLQGEKFDPAGDYVRRWVPELAGAPKASIHQLARDDLFERDDCHTDYPPPIVNHAKARERALAAYERVR
jgi:deoxyribodipyrimidine photo-lyase